MIEREDKVEMEGGGYEGEDIREGADATRKRKENGMGDTTRRGNENALRKRKKTRRERGGRYGGCVCNVFRGNTFPLHSVYPSRQIPLDTILSLLYTLSRPVIHRDSTGAEGWRCSFPNTQETIRKTTRIKLDIAVCDLVEIYAI